MTIAKAPGWESGSDGSFHALGEENAEIGISTSISTSWAISRQEKGDGTDFDSCSCWDSGSSLGWDCA